MNNMSKIFKCLLLSAVIICSIAKETKAFGFIPPMPWDIELNIPNNANKIVSNAQSVYRKLQSIKTNGLAGGLAGLKLGNFDFVGAIKDKFASLIPMEEKNKGNKTPGKGGVLQDSDLGLPSPNSDDALNEEVYYNAYFKLFFQLPSKDSYSGKYSVLQNAYAQKRLDYQQDIIVDTYIAGKMNEDLLNVIEKTINRLDKCRIGELRDNDCVFFGMQLGYTDPSTVEEAPTKEDEQAGMIGESTNAYIIATVYDRLLRIVEDLTAIEAIYKASKQLETVEPMTTSFNNDSTKNKFQFAYKSTKVHANAKLSLKKYLNGKVLNINLNRSQNCRNGGENCPSVNSQAMETQSMDDTEINRKLQPIEDLLTEVMILHNLKSELADYKTQYRKYLKSIEIHKRALNVLGQSDTCVVDFIQRHIPGKNRTQATKLWYGGEKINIANNHKARNIDSISRKMIEEYQQYTTDTIIGTDSNVCNGYYEENACPSGYVADKNNPCEENPKLYPCIVELATSDMAAGNYTENVTDYTTNLDEEESDNDADPAEGLIDGTKVDDIETENRKKAEMSWRIGAKTVSDLGKKGQLVFDQWNDQQEIQKEYMTNKYRNIRMIIRSTDKALSSYKIARSLSSKDQLNIEQEPVANLVRKISAVKSVDEAIADKSAIKYAATQGMCSGYSYDGSKDMYLKPVTATWKETKTQTKYVIEDGKQVKKTYTYTVNNSKDIKLECFARKKDAGSIEIVQENYIEGKNPDKSGAKTNSVSGSIDLSIKDNETSYPEVFRKEVKSLASNIENSTQSAGACPATWNYTINGIVKNFLKATLGECGTTIDAEVRNLKRTAENSKRKREVASDRLDDVMDVKNAEENKIKAIIRAYNQETTKLKNERTRLIKNRTQWSKDLSQARDDKNEVITKQENAKQRVSMIENDIRSTAKKITLTQNKLKENPSLTNLNNEIASLNDAIIMLALEMDCINNSNEKECKTCLELANNKQKCKTYMEDSYISIKEAERQIKKLDKKIEENQTKIDDSKHRVAEIDEELVVKAEEFSDNYIESAEKAQDKIEKENEDFEDFVAEDDGPRMKAKNGKYKGDDDLMVTIAAFYQNVNNKKIDDADARKEAIKYAKNKINEKWLSNTDAISNVLSNLNLPSEVKVGEILNLGMNVTLEAKTYTSFNQIFKAIKDAIINEAASQIVDYIAKSDRIIHQEIEGAVEEVNAWSGTRLCLAGEGDDVVSPSCPNTGSAYDIWVHKNYLTRDAVSEYKNSNEEPENGKITIGHLKLIEDLATPSSSNRAILEDAGIDLRVLFGIPSNNVITTDSEYFVGLPARGMSNTSAQEGVCTYGADSSKNAGCDYMAPREPLATIPPLREVFYFSALDYEEIPTSKKHGPTISSLLNFKYQDEDFEYMPEVWNYILARPNMRRDGKYQQTFVERGYGQNKIKDYLENDNFDNKKARLILARGGVYPCVLSGRVIDLEADNNIKDVRLTSRTGSIPQGASRVQCHDVGYYNQTYIQHLLADFDSSKKDSKNLALDKIKSGSNVGMYTKYSELSQFLRADGKKIKYRQLAEDSFKYLLNKKNQKNNVDRQLAETVSFKRNVMGSFLENVNAEFNARKNMDKSKQDIFDTLKVLCEQLGEYGNVVGNSADLEGDEKFEACAKEIMDNGGLADSASDINYDVSTKSCADANASRGYYTSIYCALDEIKTQKLEEARRLYKAIDSSSRYERDRARVQERLTEMKNYIEAFDADPNEISVISPGATRDSVVQAVKTADANRKTTLKTDNAAITGMDNQSRAVAYCPVY